MHDAEGKTVNLPPSQMVTFIPRVEGKIPKESQKIKEQAIADQVSTLRKLYPHGHRRFIPMLLEFMELHSKKNKDYAFGGPALGNFDRVASILKLYPKLKAGDPGIVAVIYMLKQLDAYLWMKSNSYEGAVEKKSARVGDIAVYAALLQIIEEESDDAHVGPDTPTGEGSGGTTQ